MLSRFSHVWPFCNSLDCSPPGSSVHGVFQVRILEWVPFPPPRDLPTQRSNPHLLCLLPWEAGAQAPPGKPQIKQCQYLKFSEMAGAVRMLNCNIWDSRHVCWAVTVPGKPLRCADHVPLCVDSESWSMVSIMLPSNKGFYYHYYWLLNISALMPLPQCTVSFLIFWQGLPSLKGTLLATTLPQGDRGSIQVL